MSGYKKSLPSILKKNNKENFPDNFPFFSSKFTNFREFSKVKRAYFFLTFESFFRTKVLNFLTKVVLP